MSQKLSKFALLFILAGVTFSFFIGCAGTDGKNGEDGPSSGTGGCTTNCHSETSSLALKIQQAKSQYEMSKHSTGDSWGIGVNGDSTPNGTCQRCHTHKGFVNYAVTGTFATSSDSDPSKIGCFTCHSPHSTFDENFALRITASTSITLNGNLTASTYGTKTYTKLKGSLCANCHHATKYLSYFSTYMGTVSTVDWKQLNIGTHNSPQADFMIGNWDVLATWDNDPAGAGAITYVGSNHVENPVSAPLTGCTVCHMTENSGLMGGHTWAIKTAAGPNSNFNTTGCVMSNCHSGSQFTVAAITSSTAVGLFKGMEDISLAFKDGDATSTTVWPNTYNILAKKIADPSTTSATSTLGCAGVFKNAYAMVGGTADLDPENNCLVSAHGRLILPGGMVTATQQDLFKATWNWLTIVGGDKSMGAHNTKMSMKTLYDACRAFSVIAHATSSFANAECGARP